MMKTNAKRKNSAVKKLIPAAGMLALSASMLATSTYAWFTMNKEVTVTGMQLRTKVGSNLLVCDTNVEADYSDDLVQTRKALLEPVSTINASDTSFYYTVNAAADGHWMGAANSMTQYAESSSTTNSTSTALGKAGYDNAFNGEYGISTPTASDFGTAYGYVDYVIFLKATSEADASAIKLTECNLLYDKAALGSGDYAWRVAIFADEVNGGNGTTNQAITSDDTKLVSILDIDGSSKNWNEETAGETGPKAITDNNGTIAKAAVTKANSAVTFGNIDTGDTAYYKVVARVWLEGEDESCNSATYAALSDKIWQLGLQFELNQGTAVNTIASDASNDTGALMQNISIS